MTKNTTLSPPRGFEPGQPAKIYKDTLYVNKRVVAGSEEARKAVGNYPATIMNDQYSPYPRILSSSELMAAFTALTTSLVSTITRKKLQQDYNHRGLQYLGTIL